MPDQSVYIFVAMYPGPADAQVDYNAVKELYRRGEIAAYDAAVVYRDEQHLVRVAQDDKLPQHSGVAVGSLLGLLYPLARIWETAVGSLAPGLSDHFSRGLSHDELVLLGEMLESDSAALVVVARSPIEVALHRVGTHASRQYEQELATDSHHFQQDFDEAVVRLVASEP